MKNRLFLSTITLLCLFFTSMLSAEFEIQMIYFQPTDAPHLADIQLKLKDFSEKTQKLYETEMDKQGFGEKTYRVERDDNDNVIIHHVVGKHASNHYTLSTTRRILADMPDKLNPDTPPSAKRDTIRVYIVGGISLVNGNSWGIGWTHHSGRYGGSAVIAFRHLDEFVLFHEIKHCLGLYHRSDHKRGTLSHYEARWLDKHYHFNNKINNAKRPRVVNNIPTLKSKGVNVVQCELQLVSDVALHQAQIFRSSDVVVIGYDYLNGKQHDTASFSIARDQWEQVVYLQVMDTDGNHILISLTIKLPAEAEQRTKNPDLGTTDPTEPKDDIDVEEKDDNPDVELSFTSKQKLTTLWARLKMQR